jgi:5-methylcytosine-specific restriction endonuclease McrA
MTKSGPDARGKRRTESGSWKIIRRRIYQRDGGMCRACGRFVYERGFRCGHIVDRAHGGTDEDENLAVMCPQCEDIKPYHRTIAEFDAWVASGGPWDANERERVFGRYVRQLAAHWNARLGQLR